MTEGEMQKMQQEAIRRAQEMHRRAGAHSRKEPEEPPKEPPRPPEPEEKSPPASLPLAADSGGIFDTLFRDKEKTLILGILLLLMDEKTDNGLLLALMYLLI